MSYHVAGKQQQGTGLAVSQSGQKLKGVANKKKVNKLNLGPTEQEETPIKNTAKISVGEWRLWCGDPGLAVRDTLVPTSAIP